MLGLFTVALLVTAAQCGTPPTPEVRLNVPPAPPREAVDHMTILNAYFSRYVDEEAGVVCWVYDKNPNYSTSGAGLSCLPLSVTNLR